MITDKEANTVYFSELITSKEEFREPFSRIQTVLERYKIDYKFLSDTKDIWCRDYMPIQKAANTFVQFRYEPSYLKNELDSQSDPAIVLKSNGIEAELTDINIDGGNMIRWTDKVIMTTRIFKENPAIDEILLVNRIEKLLEAEVHLIPDINSDTYGHADGHVRFIDDRTVLVNELKDEYKYWQNGFRKFIQQTGYNYIEIPWFEHSEKGYPDSAIGGYTNFLEIGDLIVFPIFEVTGNKDDEAVKVIKNVFPNRMVETININEIGRCGGLMNCISWTVKL